MALSNVFLCVAVFLAIEVYGMDVYLNNIGKAVRGSNITFTATVSDYQNDSYLKFIFHDNAEPQYKESFSGYTNVTRWTVEYPKNLYESGDYTVSVTLMESYFGLWVKKASATTSFQLTDMLNGNLILNQNNEDRHNNFVFVNKTLHHYIKLSDNDLEYINKNYMSVKTFWFIDCIPIDITDDFSLNYTYVDNMSDHHVEALVIADNTPIITTTTTTSTKTTTSTTTTTTPKPTTTTNKPPTTNVTTTTEVSNTTDKTTTIANNTNTVIPLQNETVNKTRSKRSISSISSCNNIVPIGENSTYGRYEVKLSVREPISAINISGQNWLQHGDLLNLEVKYLGSPPFDYCILYKLGQYNVTGNETCRTKTRTVSNAFPLVHYFSDSEQYTVVVLIENDLGKAASRATINIYKTSVHTQLSVIVVPVFFCLVAVILVVFGIAYYQHRSRHTVEVADFDFGQAHPDFMTFGERLRDSFRNAFNFGNRDDTDPLTPNTRYDHMS